MTKAAIVDIDGTLVDSNYHHTLAWDRAFRSAGIQAPLWRIHRHIGMGGDQLVEALAGEAAEHEHGDAIRAAEKDAYLELIDEVRPLPGARELLERFTGSGHVVVLASSAKEDEVDHYVDLLGARELASGWTTSAEVEATKPEPDLVQAALAIASEAGWQPGDGANMIGDSVWDVEAAIRAGIDAIGVLSGGFGEDELRAAGAAAVFPSVAELATEERVVGAAR